MPLVKSFRELVVYQKAFRVAMDIYELTKAFPQDERYSLVDQIRRSSRSVCSNVAEAWRKRAYQGAFRSKLADAMQEASETQCWLDFCLACEYLPKDRFETLDGLMEVVISMLNEMQRKAEDFSYKKSG